MLLKARPDLDLKGFAAGLAGGVLAVLGVAAVLGMQAGKTAETLQELMASKMVVIEKPGFPQEVDTARAVEKPEAQAPQEVTDTSAPPLSPSPPTTETPAAKQPNAPLPGLTEKTAQGLVPIIRKSDGLSPFKAYARSDAHPPSLPRIAVVVNGYGLKEDYSVQALGMPADITLLISPYAAQPSRWQQKAQETGHELWLDLPMETDAFGSNDPGPRALSSTETLEQNEIRLNGILAQAAGYAGVAGFYSDRFKAATLTIQALFSEIFGRGLGYLELNPAPPSTIAETAEKKGAPYAQGVINLGDSRFSGHMEDAFDIAEGLALDKKPVILVVPAYPRTLDTLDAWQKTLAAKGIVLAPLSAIAAGKGK